MSICSGEEPIPFTDQQNDKLLQSALKQNQNVFVPLQGIMHVSFDNLKREMNFVEAKAHKATVRRFTAKLNLAFASHLWRWSNNLYFKTNQPMFASFYSQFYLPFHNQNSLTASQSIPCWLLFILYLCWFRLVQLIIFLACWPIFIKLLAM